MPLIHPDQKRIERATEHKARRETLDDYTRGLSRAIARKKANFYALLDKGHIKQALTQLKQAQAIHDAIPLHLYTQPYYYDNRDSLKTAWQEYRTLTDTRTWEERKEANN